jgi:hypothetical protein
MPLSGERGARTDTLFFSSLFLLSEKRDAPAPAHLLAVLESVLLWPPECAPEWLAARHWETGMTGCRAQADVGAFVIAAPSKSSAT